MTFHQNAKLLFYFIWKDPFFFQICFLCPSDLSFVCKAKATHRVHCSELYWFCKLITVPPIIQPPPTVYF